METFNPCQKGTRRETSCLCTRHARLMIQFTNLQRRKLAGIQLDYNMQNNMRKVLNRIDLAKRNKTNLSEIDFMMCSKL